MKRLLLFALILLSFFTACGSREKKEQESGINGSYHAFVLDSAIVTVQLPETWAYSYEPDYNGMYFHQVLTQRAREEEITKEMKVLNFHYGTDEGCFSVYQGDTEEDTGTWDEYMFPDGTSGQRMVSEPDDRYRELLYHEETGMLVCLDASKSEYEKYKKEIRQVFDSIVFGTGSLPGRMQADGTMVESYELHLYEWALKVDMVAQAGISVEWDGYMLEEQPESYGYEYFGYVWSGREKLSVGEDGKNIMIIGTEMLGPETSSEAEIIKSYTVALASGMNGERTDFIYEGEEWSYVQLFYPDVRILFHGEEMEQMLQSVRPW
ncbi:MAG: hypothetical protein K2O03_04990 [Lachnospiraceae bacterium]|nr:hypothetical protein [Lachnospiraceae bacterium]